MSQKLFNIIIAVLLTIVIIVLGLNCYYLLSVNKQLQTINYNSSEINTIKNHLQEQENKIQYLDSKISDVEYNLSPSSKPYYKYVNGKWEEVYI